MKYLFILMIMMIIPVIVSAQDKEQKDILDKFSYTVDEFTGDVSYYPVGYDSWIKYSMDNILVGVVINNDKYVKLGTMIYGSSVPNESDYTALFLIDDDKYEMSINKKFILLNSDSSLAGFVFPLFKFKDGTIDTGTSTPNNLNEILNAIVKCDSLKIRINYSNDGIIKLTSKDLIYFKDYIKLFNALEPLKKDVPAAEGEDKH